MRILLFISAACLSLQLVAQQANPQKCLTDQITEQYLKDHPEMISEYQKQISITDQYRDQPKPLQKAGVVRIIPVVFHIMHAYGAENISKQKIQDQLRRLNEDFRRTNPDTSSTRATFKPVAADVEVQFRLANIDPNGKCTDGIVRIYTPKTFGANRANNEEFKALSRWDNTKYLNVWVINDIIDTDGDPNTTTLGFAYLPYSTWPAVDGIVIRADRVNYPEGRTLTHEVGHYLGLQHTFQSGCVSSASCGSNGDRCCDTPPVAAPSYGCNTSISNCESNTIQIENYMDYANSSCMNMFTFAQKSIIDAVLNTNQYRSNLWKATNLSATGTDDDIYTICGPKADFYTNYSSTCAGLSINFFDASFRSDSYSRLWEFEGGSPSSSTLANPVANYSAPGTYAVKLKVYNFEGADSMIKTSYITIKPAKGEFMAPLSQNFESTNFNDNGWTIEATSTKWQLLSTVGYSGSGSIKAPITSSTSDGIAFSFKSPGIDLSTYPAGSKPSLYFKYAYRQRATGVNDALKMYISQDCGATWVQRLNRSGANLSTVTGVGANFTPASQADWKMFKYDLSPYISSTGGNKNLLIRFEAISDMGGPIYIDDINVGYNALGLENMNQVANFNLYPNPTENKSILSFDLIKSSEVQISITDITGREIYRTIPGTMAQGTHELSIDASLFTSSSTGIYFVKLVADGVPNIQKLVLIGGAK